jgi:hypothetical protein
MHLDCDLQRLPSIKAAMELQKIPHQYLDIICFPWQRAYLNEYLGLDYKYHEISIESVEKKLGIPGKENWMP